MSNGDGSYCAQDDVFVGSAAAGVVKPPPEHAGDLAWLATHCWVCGRSSDEIRKAPR
jgi:hypothetical protein